MAQEMILAKLSQLQGFGEKFIETILDVSNRVKTLEAVGAQANLIERILVNGDPLSVGENKTVNIPVPTRVNQLENDASYQENVIERIQVNGVTQGITGKTVNVHMPTAVSELTNDENYQTNVLEGVKVNGTALTVDAEKNVNVSVPTKVSQLTNDKTYQTKTEVENTVKTAVAGSKHTSFQKVSSVPAAADAKEDIMYLVMNSVTKHYGIYAKIADDAGNFKMELLDDTTVDLSGYVQKEAGKGLSHNDFTDALLAKLNGIAEKANLYVHPGHTAYAEGLYKVTVDALGHVTKAVGVTKADITGLGIPGQDTHDWAGITGKPTSYPPSGHTHAWGDITGKPSTFTPSAHKHVKADITDFPTSMPASDVAAWAKAASKPSYAWSEITGKPSTFAPSSHTHTSVIDSGNGTAATTFAYSKSDMKYADYNWLAGWNGYELRAIHKNQFAQADHNHDDRYYTESEIDAKLVKKADTHSHPYLPTAGGNMGGTAMIAWPDSGNWSNKNDGVTFPVKRGGLSWLGQSDGIQLFAEETSNDNLELVLQFADDNSNGLTIRNKSGAAVSRLDANGGFSGSVAWEKITGKPSTFTPATHSHAWGDITGKPTTFAPSSHNHDDRYYTESEMDTKLSGKANSSHTHNYAGSSSAGGTAASVNGFTFGAQTSDPGANSSLTTNKFLFVYE